MFAAILYRVGCWTLLVIVLVWMVLASIAGAG